MAIRQKAANAARMLSDRSISGALLPSPPDKDGTGGQTVASEITN
jgi:hypothetical protein